jgi:hypothetical protein
MSLQTTPYSVPSISKKFKAGIALALGAMCALAISVSAFPSVAQAVDDTITATGTSTATFNFAVDETAAPFGTNLDPNGTDSNAAGVVDYQNTNGSFYAISDAATATIESNKAYSGSVAAADNTGSSTTMTPAASLKWKLGGMSSLADASTGATPFTSSANATVFDTASGCSSGTAKSAGDCSFDYGYSLNEKWTDMPGSFSSVLTYSAVQAA